MSRWMIPVIVLPGTVLVFVPVLIVWTTQGTEFAASLAEPQSLLFWMGLTLGVPGAVLAVSSMMLFFRFGEGTAAPWDPPQRLVVAGPYRHVRNPMLSGVIALLIAEALLLRSWPVGLWAAVFTVGNMIYFPLSEEPALIERFGDDYRLYSQHVGRWIPRLRPWRVPFEDEASDA